MSKPKIPYELQGHVVPEVNIKYRYGHCANCDDKGETATVYIGIRDLDVYYDAKCIRKEIKSLTTLAEKLESE